jgi:hypothetical protein
MNLHILKYPNLSGDQIKARAVEIHSEGHRSIIVNHGQNDGFDGIALDLPIGALEYHHVLLLDQGWVHRGRKVIAHLNPVSELELDEYILDTLKNSHYNSDFENILIDGEEPVIVNDIVENVVEDNVIEDEVVDDDVIENNVNDITHSNWFNEGH